jgi:ribonucleotide monophosphatase NagD (HAD superfamily)
VRPKTIILDIDGVIFKHLGAGLSQQLESCQVLPGVINFFNDQEKQGNGILLLTARKESHRAETEAQLRNAGLFWDLLVMGAAPGPRVLINDVKGRFTENTATAINVLRNEGLENVVIP